MRRRAARSKNRKQNAACATSFLCVHRDRRKVLFVAFICVYALLFAGTCFYGNWQLPIAATDIISDGGITETGTSAQISGDGAHLSPSCPRSGRAPRSKFFKIAQTNCDGTNAERFRQDCDWGLVQKYRSKLQTRPLEPFSQYSSLRCVDDDRYCEGKQIMLDTSVSADVFTNAGKWTTTLKGIRPWDGSNSSCDEHFAERTIMLKPDSHANFYHALCDYINIFASMHIPNDWFSPPRKHANMSEHRRLYHPEDMQILIAPYRKSSTKTFQSRFLSLYEPYTTRPILALNHQWQDEKTLCFDDLVLSLNPRGGFQSLFYNLWVPGDCSPSRLFQDWSEFVTTKPKLTSRRDLLAGSLRGKPIQFSILTRNSGKGTTSGTRHMLNQGRLLQAVQDQFGVSVHVTLLDFDWSSGITIDDQVQAILDTDILASIHGAGLAHLSFLPPWGVVYEIYDCGDGRCYSDLSRLAGLKYISGGEEDIIRKVKPKIEVKEESLSNPKFWSFIVDEEKFLANVQEALSYVLGNPKSPYYDECNFGGDISEQTHTK